MILKDPELSSVYGGATFNATFANAIIRGVTLLYSLGTYVGTALSRMFKRNYC